MLRFNADYKEVQACNGSNVLTRLELFTETKKDKDYEYIGPEPTINSSPLGLL